MGVFDRKRPTVDPREQGLRDAGAAIAKLAREMKRIEAQRTIALNAFSDSMTKVLQTVIGP